MSVKTVTMYQLVCDGCGDARKAVEEDEVDNDRADSNNNARYVAVREEE